MSLGRSVSRSGGFLPELAGEPRRRIVQDGLEVTGPNVRVDLTRRDTCETVSSLDIPVSVRIKMDTVGVTLKNTTVRLDVV